MPFLPGQLALQGTPPPPPFTATTILRLFVSATERGERTAIRTQGADQAFCECEQWMMAVVGVQHAVPGWMQVMDRHLELLAKSHLETKFVKVLLGCFDALAASSLHGAILYCIHPSASGIKFGG